MSVQFELRLAAIEHGGNDAVACIVFEPEEEDGPCLRRTFHGHLFEQPVKETEGRAIFDGEMRAKGDGLPADGILVLFASPTSGPLRVRFTGNRAYLEDIEDGTEDTTQPLDRLDLDKVEAEYDETARTLRLHHKQ